jgi:hypothetical protein
MIGFTDISFTVSLNYNQYVPTPYLHTFQFTVTHALGFSVFTSRLLEMDLLTETITSNHFEVFLLFRPQWLYFSVLICDQLIFTIH